jgi:hypothetical protein
MRQRLAALVRGQFWAAPAELAEACEAAPLIASLAGRTMAFLACLAALTCLLCALFLPRRHLAQMVCPTPLLC